MLTVTTVCRYQAAFFSFIPTHSAQSHCIPCAFPRIPCSLSAFPTHSAQSSAFPRSPAHSRAFPRIPAHSRAVPRIPAQSRAFPRSPAQSDKLVIMCTNFQRVASPSIRHDRADTRTLNLKSRYSRTSITNQLNWVLLSSQK